MQYKNVKLTAMLILSLGFTGLKAQQSIPASGGNATGSGGTASYSVGQVVYTTNIGTNGSVSQGVQQPFEISVVTGLEQAKNITLQYSVYPNPVADNLILKIEGELKLQYIATLYDANSKLLETKKVEGNETTFVMKNRASAIYFLKISLLKKGSSQQEIKTFKIIKN